jgi:hypothetical protein
MVARDLRARVFSLVLDDADLPFFDPCPEVTGYLKKSPVRARGFPNTIPSSERPGYLTRRFSSR